MIAHYYFFILDRSAQHIQAASKGSPRAGTLVWAGAHQHRTDGPADPLWDLRNPLVFQATPAVTRSTYVKTEP